MDFSSGSFISIWQLLHPSHIFWGSKYFKSLYLSLLPDHSYHLNFRNMTAFTSNAVWMQRKIIISLTCSYLTLSDILWHSAAVSSFTNALIKPWKSRTVLIFFSVILSLFHCHLLFTFPCLLLTIFSFKRKAVPKTKSTFLR